MAWLIAICISSAIATALLLVPVVRQVAHTLGLVERSDGQVIRHANPAALGGGLAIFLALITAFAATVVIDRQLLASTLGTVADSWYILFAAAGAILLLGLIDDIWGLRGRQLLLLQCLIVLALVGSGTLIQQLSLFGFQIQLGALAVPVTVLWLLMSINALNLIDGADGMATTVGCVICIGLGFISLQMNSPLSSIVGFALAGALAGFLLFNRPPASIQLGDAGGMMIGLFVGVLAVWSSFEKSAVLASAPIAILAIPLFDSVAAVVRRWLTGRSIYATDQAHLHHLLQEKYGHRKMLVVVAGLCALTAMLAVVSIQIAQPWLAALGVLSVLSLLILSRSFGHVETRMLLDRTAHFAHSFTKTPAGSDAESLGPRGPLQDVGDWSFLWESLIEFAKTNDFAKVRIDLNLAWLDEAYNATWQNQQMTEKAFQLSVHVPVFAHRVGDDSQLQIGRLEFVAPANDPSVYQRMSRLSQLLADLEPEIDRVVGRLEENSGIAVPVFAVEPESLGSARAQSELEPLLRV